jgi:hypothetical protein
VGDLGVGLDRVRAGIAGYEQAHQDLLLWLHGYAAQVLRTRQRLVQELGYDWSVIIKLWDGKYPGDVPAVLASITRMKARADRVKGTEFIATQVTRRIWAACDRARDYGDIVHISGGTGRGKTLTLREWQSCNNHGRAIYLDLPVPCRQRTVVDLLAAALGNRGKTWRKGHEAQAAVEAGLSKENVLILDEAGRLLPGGRGKDFSAAEYLRRLHDVIGCGLVLSSTNLFRGEMQRGAYHAYLEQLLGRIEEPVNIPPAVSLCEGREICQSFEPRAAGELIKAVVAFANSGQGGLRTAIRLLRQARALADLNQTHLTMEHWKAAVDLRLGEQAWED